MAAPNLLSAHEYFAIDEASEFKHELIDGVLFAMAGGTPRHARLAASLLLALGTRLRGTSCSTYSSDLRVSVLAGRSYVYPDVTVVCGKLEPAPENVNTVTNPAMVVEVLSPSTERHDRLSKLRLYRNVPSLNTVWLVHSETAAVEVYERDGDVWRWNVAAGRDASASAGSLHLEIPLAELYEGVEFDSGTPAP